MKPLCFVLMPFGTKPDGAGGTIDFNAVYRSIFLPAICNAGFEPIRADEEGVGGSIHKPMFERLMICDYAIADLTTGNANVFYELGIRHAFRPRSTTITFHEGTVLPFDVSPLRGIPYRPKDAEGAVTALTKVLEQSRTGIDDSPIYQLVDNLKPMAISQEMADVFYDRVAFSKKISERIRFSRTLGERGKAEILAIRRELGNLADVQPELVVELFNALRAVGAYAEMISLYGEMPSALQQTRYLKEQYAAQLNRLATKNSTGRSEAERLLLEVIQQLGPNPETNGLLGRIYKDRYEEADAAGKSSIARGFLDKAIESYLQGFESDWRCPYPGVNALTLMERLEKPDPRQMKLLPVVRYSAERRASSDSSDYWDHATLLEIAVLARDEDGAREILPRVLVHAYRPEDREIFKPWSTARNLRIISAVRSRRGDDQSWVNELIRELESAAEEIRIGAS